MNWTGGRLQRSKANAKPLVKTQKQHFAKARLRLQNGRSSRSPVALSISHRQYGHDTEMQDDIVIGDHLRNRERSISQEYFHEEHTSGFQSPRSRHHHHATIDEPRPKRRRFEGAFDRGHCDVQAIASRVTQHVHNTALEKKPSLAGVVELNRKSAAAEPNTLKNVKRNLLKKSDWMGLSAARPLKMAFTTVEEMEHIGKRRKITEPDQQRKATAQSDSRSRPAIHRRHRKGQHGSDTSVLHTEDASIRIGANIHQTQTTPRLSNKEPQVPTVSRSASTEPMLLDKFNGGASPLGQTQKVEQALPPTNGRRSLSPEILLQSETRPAFSNPDGANKVEDARFAPSRVHAYSAEQRSEVESGWVLPTLDQVRDSKNFDELKARSATMSPKGLNFPPPSLPNSIALNEVPRNGYIVDDSSSIMNGRHLLPSCEDPAQSADKDYVAKQKLSHCEILREGHATRADPTKLSIGFWPEHPSQSMPRPDVGMPDRRCPSGSREQANSSIGLNVPPGRTAADGRAVAKPGCQGNLVEVYLPRPVFTLERQVSDEAMAKSQMGASQSSPFDLRRNTDSIGTTSSTTRSNQSWTKSPRRRIQYGGCSHHIVPPSSRPDDIAVFKTPARYAAGSRVGSLGAMSTEDRNFNLLNRTKQTPSQDSSEAIQHPNAMPSLFQPTVPKGAPRTRHLQRDDNRLSNTPSRSSWSGAAKDRKGANDEARMDSVIPAFNEVRNALEFEQTIQRRRPNGELSGPQRALEVGEMIRLNQLAWRSHLIRGVQDNSPAKSCHTSANTVLYRVEDLPSSQPVTVPKPSETDFLTQMSPMEGKLDERLVDISVYNNAARSVRSFVPAPSMKTRSRRPLQSDPSVAWAYASGLDTTLFRHATGTAFPGVQDTDVGAWKVAISRDGCLPGSRSTHRQALQASTETPVVSTQPFTWTPQAKGTGATPSRYFPRSGSPRPSSPRTDSAWETHNDIRPLRKPGQSMSSFPLYYTPIRGNPRDSAPDNGRVTASGYLEHSQVFSVQKARGGLVNAVQRDQVADIVPSDQESTFQNDQTPSAPRTHDTETLDVYPFADEDALHMLFVDSLGPYSGSPGSSTATARPGPVLDNIHTEIKQPFTFKKPRPFVGVQGIRERQNDGFKPPSPLDDYGAMGPVGRCISVVGKLKMPDKPIFVGDSVADDIESVSNM
jgi:hypothetical protein